MKQESLVTLADLKNHFLENPLQPVKRGDLASVIQIITELFAQAAEEHLTLMECIDDLAAHTRYRLKEKTLNPEG